MPKPCYFHFLNFQENGFNYNFIPYVYLTVSPGLILYKQLDFSRFYFWSNVPLKFLKTFPQPCYLNF